MTTPLLELADVSLSFKGLQALSGLTFRIEEGEICALIGPNGAGKSSLLNIINGIYRADSGAVVFAGVHYRDIHPLQAARLGIGRTFQHSALFNRLTVLDNVLTGLTRHSRTTILEQALRIGRDAAERREFRARAEEAIEFLDLAAYRLQVVSTLPYGVQKRVDLARALVSGPRLLLLDEPMAGMNRDEKQEMSRYITRLNRERGTTVVLIEHDIGVVMGLSHHVVVLDYGRKVGDGTPAEVRSSPDVIAAYLGTVH